MLSETHYRLVLNFFYFLLLDEAMTISAAFKAASLIHKKTKKTQNPQRLDGAVIKTLTEVYGLYRTRKQPIHLAPPKSDWKIPRPEYMIAWKEFMRRSDPEFSEMLVLHFILGYSVEMIAEALKMPLGTVTFRISRGLESLAESSVIRTLAPR